MKYVRKSTVSAALIAGALAFSLVLSATSQAAGLFDGKSRVTHKSAHKKKTGRHFAKRHKRGGEHVIRGREPVVAMIKSMAPSYGVPAWFALRIARIESGYNPRARGAAGEIGVFQLKCQTARGLGYRGGCGGLYNARTNIQFGLKHLGQAVRLSNGNLRLAASKHNGGLGRRSIVSAYVNRVF